MTAEQLSGCQRRTHSPVALQLGQFCEYYLSWTMPLEINPFSPALCCHSCEGPSEPTILVLFDDARIGVVHINHTRVHARYKFRCRWINSGHACMSCPNHFIIPATTVIGERLQVLAQSSYIQVVARGYSRVLGFEGMLARSLIRSKHSQVQFSKTMASSFIVDTLA